MQAKDATVVPETPSTVGPSAVGRLISPYGGRLADVMVALERREELRAASREWPSWNLSPRQVCDLELLLNGGFSPLAGFMRRADYESVCQSMRLADGTLWPIPITLDVREEAARELEQGSQLALRDPEGVMLAVLHVGEIWKADKAGEALQVFGTTSREHPGVAYLFDQANAYYLGGRLEGIELPRHYDFRHLRLTPAELRREFSNCGWTRVVAFQTRNPLHRAHLELTLRAARDVGANLLIHPAVGMTKPGDVDHYTRVRCYQAVLPRYPKNMARLALLPLAMRMAGPREAVWHAIIRRNYGCTHLIVGRDHAGPGQTRQGKSFYGPYDAQMLLREHEKELGVGLVPFKMMVYVKDGDKYMPEDKVLPDTEVATISGTELRRLLAEGREIPKWFTFPAVAEELRRTYLPKHSQGFAVFLTGLSGAGKSTIANVLLVKLLEMGGRRVTLLDGDIVRKHLSSELGFSREDRDTNVRRIGFVAAEIVKNGGIALCAPIAPYNSVRKEVRATLEGSGGFFLVHVATPLEVCEQRDRKGLYARARAGLLPQFTGISDPYETPKDADIVLDATRISPEEAAEEILNFLKREGYLVESRGHPEKGMTARRKTGGNGSA